MAFKNNYNRPSNIALQFTHRESYPILANKGRWNGRVDPELNNP